MSIDYNEKNQTAGRGGGKSRTFSSFSGVSNKSHQGQSPGARTRKSQHVARGGGGASASAVPGTTGLHLNKVSRPVNTGYMKNETETCGGGHTSLKNIHGNTDVQPEC